MERLYLTVMALSALVGPGVYIGLQVAIAYTVFKAITKKK